MINSVLDVFLGVPRVFARPRIAWPRIGRLNLLLGVVVALLAVLPFMARAAGGLTRQDLAHAARVLLATSTQMPPSASASPLTTGAPVQRIQLPPRVTVTEVPLTIENGTIVAVGELTSNSNQDGSARLLPGAPAPAVAAAPTPSSAPASRGPAPPTAPAPAPASSQRGLPPTLTPSISVNRDPGAATSPGPDATLRSSSPPVVGAAPPAISSRAPTSQAPPAGAAPSDRPAPPASPPAPKTGVPVVGAVPPKAAPAPPPASPKPATPPPQRTSPSASPPRAQPAPTPRPAPTPAPQFTEVPGTLTPSAQTRRATLPPLLPALTNAVSGLIPSPTPGPPQVMVLTPQGLVPAQAYPGASNPGAGYSSSGVPAITSARQAPGQTPAPTVLQVPPEALAGLQQQQQQQQSLPLGGGLVGRLRELRPAGGQVLGTPQPTQVAAAATPVPAAVPAAAPVTTAGGGDGNGIEVITSTPISISNPITTVGGSISAGFNVGGGGGAGAGGDKGGIPLLPLLIGGIAALGGAGGVVPP